MAGEITLSREALNLLGSTRLPKEEQLEHYLEQLQVDDPYNGKLFPSLEQIVLTDPTCRCAHLGDACIAQSFRSMQPPGWVMPPDITGPSGSITKTVDDLELLADLPTDFVTRLPKLHHESWQLYSYTITRGTALRRSRYQAEQFVTDTLNLQRRIFLQTLERQGYIKTRGEAELIEEIQRRKDQFPGQRIYVLLGTDVARYMDNIYGAKIWKDAYMVKERRYTYYGNLKHYSSAVFTESQIRASHKYQFEYACQRIPRKWVLLIGMVHQFSLDMDECIVDNKVVKPKSNHRFSFDV